MNKKKMFISADSKLQTEIAKAFDVSKRFVRGTMNWEWNSSKAKSIRKYALDHGARLFEEVETKMSD